MARTGIGWDTLRCSYPLAEPVLNRLLADSDDRHLVGPVLWDTGKDTTYWLLKPGHTPTYPDAVRLLSPGSWLTLPNPRRPSVALAWLHLPRPAVLTAPSWLASALWDQLAAADPHLGTP